MFYGGEMNVGGAGGNLAGLFRERMQQGGMVPTQDPRLAGISFDINESAKNRKMRGVRKLAETGVGGEKDAALEKIESHEKLCRIMQKQTHSKISAIEADIKEIKNHMRYAMTALVGGMFAIIVILFEKL